MHVSLTFDNETEVNYHCCTSSHVSLTFDNETKVNFPSL